MRHQAGIVEALEKCKVYFFERAISEYSDGNFVPNEEAIILYSVEAALKKAKKPIQHDILESDINIKVLKYDGELEDRKVSAHTVGGLAVHLETGFEFTGERYVISNIHQGMKFPGSVSGFRAAIACANDLSEIADWDSFDGSDGVTTIAAKQILKEWGFKTVLEDYDDD